MSDMKKAMMETQDGGKVRYWEKFVWKFPLWLCIHLFHCEKNHLNMLSADSRQRSLCLIKQSNNSLSDIFYFSSFSLPSLWGRATLVSLKILFNWTNSQIHQAHSDQCQLSAQILLNQILTLYQGIWNGWIEAFVASDICAISCNLSFLTHGWLGSDTQNTFQTIPETREGAIEINI